MSDFCIQTDAATYDIETQHNIVFKLSFLKISLSSSREAGGEIFWMTTYCFTILGTNFSGLVEYSKLGRKMSLATSDWDLGAQNLVFLVSSSTSLKSLSVGFGLSFLSFFQGHIIKCFIRDRLKVPFSLYTAA